MSTVEGARPTGPPVGWTVSQGSSLAAATGTLPSAITLPSAATVTARPLPGTTPAPSQQRGPGAAVSSTASSSVTAGPGNVRLTGISESLAVIVTDGLPAGRTVATACP